MTYVMGIDGGGSNVRVVIVSPDLSTHGESKGPTANPSAIGHEAAAANIQQAVRDALTNARLTADDIAAVGLGIAGAEARRSETWLRQVMSDVLPNALVAPGSDGEIALVGSTGERLGVLALAGTGSVFYGINSRGESLMLGGWGYLLGDEGSGYWLTMKALQAITRADDGLDHPTALQAPLLAALGVETPRQIITWLYGNSAPRTAEIAALAPIVLDAAANDPTARAIVDEGAACLAKSVRTVIFRLGMERLPIAFAGGLLENENPLSLTLRDLLGLEHFPTRRYPPVIGAALLALKLCE